MQCFPKPAREVDAAYLRHVRGQRCLVCHNGKPDAHHMVSRGAGGSDYTCLALCRQHHSELHQIGRARFEQRYGVDLWAACAATLASYTRRLVQLARLYANGDQAAAWEMTRAMEWEDL